MTAGQQPIDELADDETHERCRLEDLYPSMMPLPIPPQLNAKRRCPEEGHYDTNIEQLVRPVKKPRLEDGFDATGIEEDLIIL